MARDELFTPGCELDEERKILVCKPKLVLDGKIYTSVQPIELKMMDNGKALIIKDGQAPQFVIDRLAKYLEERRL